MTKKKYLIVFIISFVGACIVGNLTEKKVRSWIEVLYEIVTGKPMVYDITQTDEKGIPYLIEATIGKQRNPMTICNRALSYHDKFMQGDSSQRILFLNCADWLTENLTTQKDFSVINYNYNWVVYNMVAPWRSGLANGVTLQVLIKAHALTHDEKYMVAASQILKSFYTEVNEGGVTYKSENQGWWFEEFSDEGGYVSRVLNGHMFAVVGIHDYSIYASDSSAKYLFDQGVMALKNNIYKYDNDEGTSYYDLRGSLSNVKYHDIHVDLLDKLYTITGDPVLKLYRDKWGAYKHPSLTKRLVRFPVKRIDIAIWLFNFAIISVITFSVFFLFVRQTQSR